MISLLFIILICLGLAFIIEQFAMKRFTTSYRKVCRPVITTNLVFVAVCILGAMTGQAMLDSTLSTYSSWIDLGGGIFGETGAKIAGQLAMDDYNSRLTNDSAFRELSESGAKCMMLSWIIGIIVLVFTILTYRAIIYKKRYGFSSLSAFYVISGVLCSIVYSLIEGAGGEINAYYGNDSFGIYQYVFGFIFFAALCIVWYFAKYKKKLKQILSIESKSALILNNSQDKSIGSSIASVISKNFSNTTESDKPTKTCPFCGETILAVAVKCKHCGEWLPKEEEKKMVECKVCGEMVEEGSETCPYCHEKIDGSSAQRQEPKVKMITCPICAEQIPDNVDICPICNEKIK